MAGLKQDQTHEAKIAHRVARRGEVPSKAGKTVSIQYGRGLKTSATVALTYF